MKNTEKGLSRHLVINVIILFVAIFGILILSRRENYARQMQQVNEYTSELSGRTALHVSDVFQDKKNAIASIAYLYRTAIESPEVDRELLRSLEKRSGFDRIRFVNLAGESYTSDSKIANVSDILDYIKAGDREEVRKSLQGGKEISFAFSGAAGSSVGSLVPIEGTPWMLLQLFPSRAAKEMVTAVNNDEQVVLLLFMVVMLWFMVQMFCLLKRRSALEQQRKNSSRVTTLLRNVADDYISLIDVDLNTEMEEQFRLNEDVLQDGMGNSYGYARSMEAYTKTIVSAKDRECFGKATQLSELEGFLYRIQRGAGRRRATSPGKIHPASQ